MSMRRTKPPLARRERTHPTPNPDLLYAAMEAYKRSGFIMINKLLIRALGFVEAGVLGYYIDQFRYTFEHSPQNGGWFYRTHEDVATDLNLPINTVKRMKQALIQKGILVRQMYGSPAKEWITVDFRRIDSILRDHLKISHDRRCAPTPPEAQILTPLEAQILTPLEAQILTPLIYNKNILNKNERKDMAAPQVDEGTKNDSTINDRDVPFLPLAQKLADIIKTRKKINSRSSIRAWASEIRRLSQSLMEDDDAARIRRIERALDWYAEHIGEEYVPVIESGASLRQKFARLEAAIERSGGYSSNNSKGGARKIQGPRRIIDQALRSPTLVDAFFRSCYMPAKELIGARSKEEQADLAQALVDFYDDIVHAQRNLPRGLLESIPEYGPMSIIEAYIHWVRDSSWITNVSHKIFSVSHSLFGRFRAEYAYEVDNRGRDPLTGRSRIMDGTHA